MTLVEQVNDRYDNHPLKKEDYEQLSKFMVNKIKEI